DEQRSDQPLVPSWNGQRRRRWKAGGSGRRRIPAVLRRRPPLASPGHVPGGAHRGPLHLRPRWLGGHCQELTVQCAILAGGLGTRVAAVAPGLPKALIPVAGEPFAAHQLSLLSQAGIRRVVYCIGHRADAIRDFVARGDRWGLEVAYVEDGDTLLGTAGALR